MTNTIRTYLDSIELEWFHFLMSHSFQFEEHFNLIEDSALGFQVFILHQLVSDLLQWNNLFNWVDLFIFLLYFTVTSLSSLFIMISKLLNVLCLLNLSLSLSLFFVLFIKKSLWNPKKKRKSDNFSMKRKRAHVPYESPKSGNLEYFTRNRI